jgi:hypothetical protein
MSGGWCVPQMNALRLKNFGTEEEKKAAAAKAPEPPKPAAAATRAPEPPRPAAQAPPPKPAPAPAAPKVGAFAAWSLACARSAASLLCFPWLPVQTHPPPCGTQYEPPKQNYAPLRMSAEVRSLLCFVFFCAPTLPLLRFLLRSVWQALLFQLCLASSRFVFNTAWVGRMALSCCLSSHPQRGGCCASPVACRPHPPRHTRCVLLAVLPVVCLRPRVCLCRCAVLCCAHR